MKTKIKGYNFKGEKFLEAAEELTNCDLRDNRQVCGYDFATGSFVHNHLKHLCLLEVWTYPVEEVKELTVGKWYKNRDYVAFRICRPDGTKVKGFGIKKNGEWHDNREGTTFWGHMNGVDEWVELTEKEVRKELKKYAIAQGFGEIGRKFTSPVGIQNRQKQTVETEPFFYSNVGYNHMAVRHEEGVIFSSDTGRWATLVDEEPKLPEINGYEGEDRGDHLKYGCAVLSKEWFKSTSNRCIVRLELDSEVTILQKDVEQIRDYLKFKGE